MTRVPCVPPLARRKKRLAELHQQTICFSLLWKIYNLSYFFHCKYYAHLAALMGMNAALEMQDDLQVGRRCGCLLRVPGTVGYQVGCLLSVCA